MSILTHVIFLLSCITASGQHGPEIVKLTNDTARTGSSAIISCSVANQQRSTPVQWMFMETFEGGEMLTTNEQFITNNTVCREGVKKYEISKQESQEYVTYKLVVNCLERTDEGRYMCFVHVPGLEPLDFPIRMARITVQCKCSSASSARIFAKNNSVVEAKLGESITLVGMATGEPIPNITWVRDDGSLMRLPDGRTVVSVRHYILTLVNVTKSDSGFYRCIASNTIEPDADYVVELLVTSKPETTAVCATVGVVTDRHVDAKLECLISGHPKPDNVWLMEPQNNTGNITIQLINNERYTMAQTPVDQDHRATIYTLTIKHVVNADFGKYVCRANNELGTSSSSIELFECHETCKSTCLEVGPKGCDDCKSGWRKLTDNQCSKKECHLSCSGCYDNGADKCIECAAGYISRNGTCIVCKCRGPNCPSSTTQRITVSLIVPFIYFITIFLHKTAS